MSETPPPEEKAGQLQKYDFDSIHLQVGSRLQLTRYRANKPSQFFTSLIGYVKNEYLLVKTPFENGIALSFLEGEKITIRAFSGTNVCTFSSTVDRVSLQPYFYLHLSFPKVIEGTPLRKALRVKVNIPATIHVPRSKEQDTAEVPAVITNLSIVGALLESEKELQNDQTVDLSFMLAVHSSDLEAFDMQINTRAVIRNAKAQKADSPKQSTLHTYGVQFVDMDSTYRVMLQNLTYEAMIGDRQKLV